MDAIRDELKALLDSSINWVNELGKIPKTPHATVQWTSHEIEGGKQQEVSGGWGPNFVWLKSFFTSSAGPSEGLVRLVKSMAESPSLSNKLPFDGALLSSTCEIQPSYQTSAWVWRCLVLPCLLVSPIIDDKFEVSETVIADTVDSVVEDLHSRTFVSIRHLSPLLNFAVDREIELGPGIKLRKPTDNELVEWVNQVGYPLDLSYLPGTGAVMDISYAVTRGGEDVLRRWAIPGGGSDKLKVPECIGQWNIHCGRTAADDRNDLLRVLRLLTGRQVSIPFTQHATVAPLFCLESTTGAPDPPDLFYSATVPIPHDDVVKLSQLWRRFRQDVGTAHKLQIPLRRWAGTWDRWQKPIISSAEDIWKDVLIDYWIGLESLFTPEAAMEITYRASLRIAAFLGKDSTEKKTILKQVKDSYAWRSAIVHGGSDSSKDARKRKERMPLTEAVNITGELLRRSILSILEANESFEPERVEESLLDGVNSAGDVVS